MIIGTLCFIVKNGKVLLAMKKRGLGKGKWNGTGGKAESNEKVKETMIRETKEEIGIVPKNPKLVGKLYFYFENQPNWLVHVFRSEDYQGKPVETEEMKPAWFKFNKVPYKKMWADDKHWLPLLLAGKCFEGKFWFKDEETLTDFKVAEK